MSTFTPARRTGKRDTFVPAKRSKRDVFIPAIRPARQGAPGFTPAKRAASKGQVFVPAKRPASSDKFYPAKGKGKLEGIGLLSMRGIDYPEWYHGLIDHTYIEVTKIRDRADVRCRFLFGKDKRRPATTTKDIKFNEIDNRLERARISFFQHGEINLDVLRTPIGRDYGWPVNVDTDLFDHITLEVRDDGSNELFLLTHIRVVLNGIVILDRSFEQRRVEKYFQMDRYIGEYRLSRVPHSDDSPVLHTAALELGKSWSPKYHGLWEKITSNQGDIRFFKSQPKDWCSEFVAWCLYQATELEPPFNSISGTHLARYFNGRCFQSDIFNQNRMITPNANVILWDVVKDSPKKYDFIGNCDINGKTYMNNNRCCRSWDDLPTSVEPGYYAKVYRGRFINEPFSGHSTIFVCWLPTFEINQSTNFFYGLGGDQGNVVKILTFSISKTDSTAAIYWKDTENEPLVELQAFGDYGYYDGFGRTNNPARTPTFGT